MTNQIELLVALQDLDLALRARTDAMDHLRERVAELTAELEEQGSVLEACRAEQATHQARRREIEAILADEGAKTTDRRMRLNRVRTEKEAAAINREIEVSKEGTAELEEELILLFDTLDGINARVDELQAAYDAILAKRDEAQVTADKEIAELSAGIDQANKERDELAATLEANVRRIYENILQRRKKQAIVEVRSGACQGCHMHVSPQLFNEIKRNERVIVCPSCHRILFARSERAADAG